MEAQLDGLAQLAVVLNFWNILALISCLQHTQFGSGKACQAVDYLDHGKCKNVQDGAQLLNRDNLLACF